MFKIILLLLVVVAVVLVVAKVRKARASKSVARSQAPQVARENRYEEAWTPRGSTGYSRPGTPITSKPVKRREEDSTYGIVESGDTDFSGYAYEPPTYDEPSKPSYEAPSSTTDYTPSNYSSGGYTAPDTSYSSGGYSGGSSSDSGSSSSSSSSSDSGGGSSD